MFQFLGIGAQKAGTTWLYRNLSLHPGIEFPLGKEAHFWNQPHDEQAVVEYLLRLDSTATRCAGEITPAYGFLPRSTIQEIRKFRPGIHLIYILRNPMQRAWSAALMALERAEMQPHEASDQWFIDHFHSAGSLKRGDYEACLRNWLSVFSPEQLLLLRFEHISTWPAELLNRCFRFLQLPPMPLSELRATGCDAAVFSGSGEPLRPTLLPALRDLYYPKIRALEAYLGQDFSHWLI